MSENKKEPEDVLDLPIQCSLDMCDTNPERFTKICNMLSEMNFLEI